MRPRLLQNLRKCSSGRGIAGARSEEHTSELQSRSDLVCRLLLEKKKSSDGMAQYAAAQAPIAETQAIAGPQYALTNHPPPPPYTTTLSYKPFWPLRGDQKPCSSS